ncbi:MAG: MBOAT family O-acyltransferase [Eubacteriales bacterium]
MVFSNLIFLYVFLPLNLLCYSLAKDIRTKNVILLIFSLVFYAWGEPKFVLLLVSMTFIDWLFSLGIEKFRGTGKAKMYLILACTFSLGLLGIFKYGSFTIANIQALTGFPAVVPKIALPIGISFYTFQILSYVIDVYRGEIPAQHNFGLLLMYKSLFHVCIAGPIVRYKDISEELLFRKTTPEQFSAGITRFTVGLGKKALLANTCGSLTNTILLADKVASDPNLLSANITALSGKPAILLWLGVVMFMLQIYLDFSAYSDMAIGMGLMIGFHYKENFLYPYTASSVTQFWRQWHISLSSFFRDYVYFPLGGSRKGKARTVFNLLVVWLLTGLWHGASWNFVLWGLYFFIFIVFEKLVLGKVLDKIPKFFGHAYLLLIVFFSWILFRFRRLTLVWVVFKGLFCGNGNMFTSFEAKTMWLNYLLFLAAAIIAVTPLAKKLYEKLINKAGQNVASSRVLGAVQVSAVVIVILLSTLALIGNSYNPFIYFQF